jgi:hypothetical protein
MKKMLFISIVLSIGLFSCMDVLDKAPLDIISDKVVWEDKELTDAYLTGAYAATYVLTNEVGSDEDYMNELWTAWSVINAISDECRSQYSSWTQPWKHGGLKIDGGLLEWWENSYSVIRKLNEFLQHLQNSSLKDEEFKKRRMAEARFLRAFNYFYMVKRYGGVPLITTPQSLNDSEEILYPVRNKEKDIYDFVISEMEEISKDLPEKPEQIGRPSKYSAIALMARASLYAASIAKYGTVQLDGILGIPSDLSDSYFKKSYIASEEIINSGKFALYSKNPDKAKNFREIFTVKNNSEIIFVRPHNYIDANSGGCGWSYDFFQCPAPQAWGCGNQDGPYLEMIEAFDNIDGSSGKLDRTAIQQGLWTTEELWRNKDPRFFGTIYTQNTPWKGGLIDWHNGLLLPDGSIQTDGSYNGVMTKGTQTLSYTGGGTGFGVLKYLDEKKDNFTDRNGSGTDWIVFRYGEVLLNYAEAAEELGYSDEALWAVNELRNRAGIAPLTKIDINKIRHERRVELAFEGHRYWDLRRWRTAVNELTGDFSGLRYILDYDTRKFKLEILEKIDGSEGPKFYPYNYYLPITIARTANNPNLIENPGY